MAPPNTLTAAERAEAMGVRLLETMRAGLIAPDAAEFVCSAYTLAMQPRVAMLSVKDTRLLHPGRTVLILWQDCGVRDPGELAAGALVETQDLSLRAELSTLNAPEVVALAESIPSPSESGEQLLEDLLALDARAARIAVAERLDHLRHLHLGDPSAWREQYTLATEVYLPVAQRTHPELARRMARWSEMFARHRLRG